MSLVYFGHLLKIIKFSSDLNVTLPEKESRNIYLELYIWENLPEFNISIGLEYAPFSTSSDCPLTSASLFSSENFPKIAISSSYQDLFYISMEERLDDVYHTCKSKVIVQRLNHMLFFLPEYFDVSVHSTFAVIKYDNESCVLYTDDDSGCYGLTFYDQKSKLPKTDTFTHINELSEGIMKKYLRHVMRNILGILSDVSDFFLIANNAENCIMHLFKEFRFIINIDRNGLSFYANDLLPEKLLVNQSSFDFNINFYYKLVSDHVDKIYQQHLSQYIENRKQDLQYFNSIKISNGFLIGHLNFTAERFHSIFVSIEDGNFFIPVQLESDISEYISTIFLIDQFLLYGKFLFILTF